MPLNRSKTDTCAALRCKCSAPHDPLKILERHIDSLGARLRPVGKPPEPFALPDYLFADLEFSSEFVLRARRCLAFKLIEPADGIIGFVLDVDGNVTYPKRAAAGPDPLVMVGRW